MNASVSLERNKAWKVLGKPRLEVLNRHIIGALWRKRKERYRGVICSVP